MPTCSPGSGFQMLRATCESSSSSITFTMAAMASLVSSSRCRRVQASACPPSNAPLICPMVAASRAPVAARWWPRARTPSRHRQRSPSAEDRKWWWRVARVVPHCATAGRCNADRCIAFFEWIGQRQRQAQLTRVHAGILNAFRPLRRVGRVRRVGLVGRVARLGWCSHSVHPPYQPYLPHLPLPARPLRVSRWRWGRGRKPLVARHHLPALRITLIIRGHDLDAELVEGILDVAVELIQHGPLQGRVFQRDQECGPT